MLVRYNGVDLEVERVVGWSDKNVYSEDNSERMMRHISLMVQCVIHPQATTLAEQFVTSAPAIAADLKRRLLEPRKKLTINVGGELILQSPASIQRDGMPSFVDTDGARRHECDAKGGPHPLYADVVSIHGTKTMLATFAIETWLVDSSVNEQIPREGAPNRDTFSPMISHRWEQSNDIDEHYFNTRVTQGRAVFRADFLYEYDVRSKSLRQATRKPSDYLADLNHPLPLNYKRESVRSSVSSDGLTLTYTIVDREQPSTIGAGKMVSSIRGTWSGGVSQPPDSITMLPEFPRYSVSINVQAVGRRGATTSELVHACLRAAATFDPGAELKRRMYFDNKISVTFGSGPRTASLSIGYQIGGAVPNIIDGVFAVFQHPVVREIDLIEKKWPETLRDDLGSPISRALEGQQPYEGMVGGLLAIPLSGGQQRLNTQQIGDGQFVPAQSPISTEAVLNTELEADLARAARGEAERRTE